MTFATVTSEGQVTIPVDMRAKLGLRPGSRLNFVPTESGGYEIRPAVGSIKDLKGSISPPAHPVSLDDLNKAIAAAAAASAR